MGLIDFVVNAGKQLFGGSQAAAAPTSDPQVLYKIYPGQVLRIPPAA